MTAKKNNVVAVSCLLTGALVWGLIWYPYRALQAAGVGGALASFLTYFVALLPGLFVFRGRRSQLRQSPWMLAAIALAAGLCNLGYVLAMIHGEVVRVMLLFYLAPLWTMVFARVLLGEKAGPVGYPIIALSLAGAIVMLWRPGGRASQRCKWLTGGLSFASQRAKASDRRAAEIRIGVGWRCAGCAAGGDYTSHPGIGDHAYLAAWRSFSFFLSFFFFFWVGGGNAGDRGVFFFFFGNWCFPRPFSFFPHF